MALQKQVHNVATGEVTLVDLSPEEVTATTARITENEAKDATEQQALSEVRADLLPARTDQITSALTQIDTDLITLQGTPTNAQVIQILTRTLQRQRVIIRAIARLADRIAISL